MEQRHKVKLTTSSSFDLAHSEIRRLYTYLSLFKYRYLRIPEYNEQKLFKTLEKDFRKYLMEIKIHCEREPNNLTLNNIHTFFDTHHSKLKQITSEYEELDNESSE